MRLKIAINRRAPAAANPTRNAVALEEPPESRPAGQCLDTVNRPDGSEHDVAFANLEGEPYATRDLASPTLTTTRRA